MHLRDNRWLFGSPIQIIWGARIASQRLLSYADAFVSTGQGLLGNNMFAYCRNNPVSRKDASGTDDIRVTDANEDNNPLNDYIGRGSGSGGNGTITYSSNQGNATTGSRLNSEHTGIGTKKLTFSSDAKLNEHYNKHNSEFGDGFASPQEYVDAANYVIQNGQYIEEYNAYVRFYGYQGRANYAFVGVSHNRDYITTFHLRATVKIFY